MNDARRLLDSPDSGAQLLDAGRSFRRRFGRGPTLAAGAPGRVNLIGEHTDYNDGYVLPLAIDRRAVVVAARADGGHSTLVAADLGEEAEVDFSRPLERVEEPGWVNYPLGVARQFQARGHDLPNLNVLLTSSVPMGSGLSSSAAAEVAVATLLEEVVGVRLEAVEKARLCQSAEHAFPGTPCGIMDMLAACCGRAGHVLLIDCRSLEVEAVAFPGPEEAVLVIVDTGVRHALSCGAYAERRATCRQAADRLGVASLRDATPEAIEGAGLTQVEHQRAMHVVLENERTVRAAERLRARDWGAVGELMFQSHDSLRYLYEVTCEELDTVVEEARRLEEAGAGVYGARMTGGGFGGCAIILCAAGAVEGVVRGVGGAFVAAHGREADSFSVRAAGPAEALTAG